MGPVQQRHLIRLLAFVVALNLVTGFAVLYTRGSPASAAKPGDRTSRAGDRAGQAVGPDSSGGSTGILANGQFNRRRRSGQVPAPNGGGPAGAPATPPSSAKPSESNPSGSASGATTGTPSSSRPKTTSPSRPGTASTTAPSTSSSSGPATTAPPAGGTAGAGGSKPAGAGGSPPAAPKRTAATFTDPAGDTVVEGRGSRKTEPRADIVQSHLTYDTKGIVLAVLTDDPVDPGQDPHWASESTFVSWELDTTGDGVVDYEVQYALSEGSPVAGVSRPGDADGSSACDADAAYTAERYAVGFDPACIGRPASVAYRVKIYYDTDPKNADADVVTDVGPDGGLSRPLARPAG